jgi:hypothetical protein
MTEQNPQDPGTSRGDVARELQELGRNLANILKDAWDSEERRRLHDEIREGMSDLSSTVDKAVSEFRESPTGQRMKEDIRDFKERVRAGEVDQKIRNEILTALKTVNQELERATRKTPPPPPPPADEPPVV